jgi:hypothetical protein
MRSGSFRWIEMYALPVAPYRHLGVSRLGIFRIGAGAEGQDGSANRQDFETLHHYY